MSEPTLLPARAAVLVDRLVDAADDRLRPALTELAASLRAETGGPAAHRLAAATGLTPFEHDLLLLAGLPEEHEAVSRLARLWNTAAEPWFTPATVLTVLRLGSAGRGPLRRALESGPLRRHRLVTGPETTPLPERGLRLPPGLWSVLRGVDVWPAGLRPVELPALPAAYVPALAAALGLDPASGRGGDSASGRDAASGHDADPASGLAPPLTFGPAPPFGPPSARGLAPVVGSGGKPHAGADPNAGANPHVGVDPHVGAHPHAGANPHADALPAGARIIVLTGPGRTDPELAALAAATVPAGIVVPAADLDPDRAPLWAAHLLARGAVPIVLGGPAGPPLPGYPGPVVVAAGAATGLALDDRPATTVELPRPDLGEALALWHGLLPGRNGAAAELAGLVRVGRIEATRAVRDATAGGPASVAAVLARVRRRTEAALPAAVRLVRPDARLDRVVLPADQHRLLRSVVDRVRGQARVLHDWGFAAAARHRGGVRLLLSGPPGTGKTLAVEAVAAELGLDLLVVDLAALVSKWLGETEKNIGEVFDAAERCQAVLFFDEADAIFGRRAEGSDPQARWANLETAYLLGRVDRSDGLVALATNLRRNLDDAFVRRLDVILEIDEPDRPARELLWRGHLPAGAPYAADVDPAALAARYEIPGGLIRNATLAAAYAAAAGDRPIDQAALIAAVRDEYRKAGRSFPGVPRAAAGARGGP